MSNMSEVWSNNKVKLSHYIFLMVLTFICCSQIAWQFGISWKTIAGCFLTYVLIIQSYIDLKYQIIPDEITWPVLWIGIFFNIFGGFTSFTSALIGAALGYLSLWIVYWIFFLVTKKEGLGYGDFKLLAMLGAWLGWKMLPLIILLSSVLGSIIGTMTIIFMHQSFNRRIAFGPFLAIAGWIALVWGKDIINWYLRNYVNIW